MDLDNIDLNKAVDAGQINNKLDGIKWITMFYPDNPDLEIENIKFAITQFEKDLGKKMIITDYQFISVLLNEYDYSVTRFWYDFHGYPSKDNKFFDYWKEFVIKKINQNNINNIYVLKPLHGEENPLQNIFGHCLEKENLSQTLYKINLNNCLH
tara:strand:+ start:588 stop:1049 length:462 start_codon:yes stop_codon:yes gene_type:complete